MTLAFKIYLGAALFGVLSYFLPPAPRDLSGFMLRSQDMPVLILSTLLLGWMLRRPPRISAPDFSGHERVVSILCALAALAIGYVGARTAALSFPLSMDEFMAVFDAGILGGGHLAAPIDAAWRPYADALQPIFTIVTEGNRSWLSNYLPINAALIAALEALGDGRLAPPVLAAISLLALYAGARRLWPKRPDAALVAVILLFTSSQFLVTAMTPYAMTAHLALNLIWLVLFLRGTIPAHVAALAVGFAATGLHQIVFHPLYVAPFVLALWIDRRWATAALYTAGYAGIGLFWISYWGLLVPGVPVASGAGLEGLLVRAADMLRFDLEGVVLMLRNMTRLIAWLNPFALVLFVLALPSIRRWPRPLPELLGGVVLTIAVMFVLMPYQGHGWGYRYLHGLLGSVVLIAAYGWISLPRKEAVPMRGVFAICTIFALVMLPLRMYQMHSFTKPYADAYAEIRNADADVVIVDPNEIWFGGDLVRNDPYLGNRPKVMVLNYLDEAEIADLCARFKVGHFGGENAESFGLRIVPEHPSPHIAALRSVLVAPGCSE